MGISIDHLTEAELVQLNEKIVQRLRMIRQMRAHVRMLDFSLGERVWFQAEKTKPSGYGTSLRARPSR